MNGVTKSVTDWSEELGIKRHIIFGRLRKGWGHAQALTTPIDQRKVRCGPVTIDGETMEVKEWAKRVGVTASMIHLRLKMGWEPRDAVFRPPVK
jgi:hypothetical protein